MRQIADGKSSQLDLLSRRQINEAGTALTAQVCDHTQLLGVREAVRHADPHHEAPWGLPPEEHAKPLQPLAIGLLDRFPSVAHETLDIGFDVEAVLIPLV